MSSVETAAIERFAQAAGELCRYLESAPSMSTATYRELARLLAGVCALAFDLPDTEPSDRAPRAPKLEALAIAFGERDTYREVFDAYANDADEPVVGSLSDDVRDIYRELMEGLAMFDAKRVADAAWSWRFSFYMHWGEHATSALRALYWLLRERA